MASDPHLSAGYCVRGDIGHAISVELVRAPVVELLPELEVEERLGGRDAVEGSDAVRDAEEIAAVAADDLDEDVELAGGDDDVVGLVPPRDLVGDGIGRARGPHPDHRLRLEAETERVRHPGDLQDVVVAESRVPGAHGCLRHAELVGDAAKRLAAVPLQRLDDALVHRVDPARLHHRAAAALRILPTKALYASQCEALPTSLDASRQ